MLADTASFNFKDCIFLPDNERMEPSTFPFQKSAKFSIFKAKFTNFMWEKKQTDLNRNINVIGGGGTSDQTFATSARGIATPIFVTLLAQ